MSPRSHRIYIGVLVSIVVATFFYLCYAGYSYYTTSLEERFYHPDHAALKPSRHTFDSHRSIWLYDPKAKSIAAACRCVEVLVGVSYFSLYTWTGNDLVSYSV